MKINPKSADFDIDTNTLTIEGINSLGKISKVQIAVNDETNFLSWIVAAFQEKSRTPQGGGKAIVADSVQLGMHVVSDGVHALSFTFRAGDMELSFLAPMHANSPERLAAIQGHLEQALKEMSSDSSVSKQ